MMTETILIQHLQRWDNPFSPEMTEEDVDRVLAREPFCHVDRAKFPSTASLRDIIRNDMRIRRYRDGDIVIRAGDYGHSAFLVLEGAVRVVLSPQLPERILGRQATSRRSVFGALSQLWTNPRTPEVRDPSRFGPGNGGGSNRAKDETHVFLQDVPGILDNHQTARLEAGEIFGEIAALGRTPRPASVFAEGDVELLEIRWQGIRDIRRRDEALRNHIDRLYRERSLTFHLRETPLFSHLSDDEIKKIADETRFETYGEFEWYASYKKLADRSAAEKLAHDTVIAEEGDYADGIVLIRSGFARVSQGTNGSHRTVSFLGRGEVFGFEEIAHNWLTGQHVCLQRSLRALGYVDILCVPTVIIETYVLPNMSTDCVRRFQLPEPVSPHAEGPVGWEAVPGDTAIDGGMFEFLVKNQYINGTATMMINLDHCTRCDDCVRACAAAHDNNPRFVRHGKRYGGFIVANACMHCTDPVCMIGCPTGAIHRSSFEGQVVIDDDMCIGCAICADSCPYDNIRMAEIRDANNNFILDRQTNAPILKATKCDLCVDQLGGPACQRACPHDALRRIDMRNLDAAANWLNGK